jgi:membrane protease subunit HflK
VGSASRLKEEADAYKSKIVSQAQGDAQRFKSVLAEYQKAPQVTRDRMYLDSIQQIYSNVTKVMVDSRQGSNLLYLPLDKVMQLNGQGADASPTAAQGTLPATTPAAATPDARTRDVPRSRERDTR